MEEEAHPEGHWHRTARPREDPVDHQREAHLQQLHHDDLGGAPAEEAVEVVEAREHRRSPS